MKKKEEQEGHKGDGGEEDDGGNWRSFIRYTSTEFLGENATATEI